MASRAKVKTALVLTSILLVISVALNVLQSSSFLNRTHFVETNLRVGNNVWTQVETNSDVSSFENGQYQIWIKTRGQTPKLVESFDKGNGLFTGLSFKKNSDSGITADYWSGGPEGGTSTQIFYDQEGLEQVRVTQNQPWRDYEFSIQRPKRGDYMVTYLAEACDEESLSTTVRGASAGTLEFLLPEPIQLECQNLDGDLFPPRIEILEIREDTLDFTIGDEHVATLIYDVPANDYGLTQPEINFMAKGY